MLIISVTSNKKFCKNKNKVKNVKTLLPSYLRLNIRFIFPIKVVMNR